MSRQDLFRERELLVVIRKLMDQVEWLRDRVSELTPKEGETPVDKAVWPEHRVSPEFVGTLFEAEPTQMLTGEALIPADRESPIQTKTVVIAVPRPRVQKAAPIEEPVIEEPL